jgi:hypothetical protein
VTGVAEQVGVVLTISRVYDFSARKTKAHKIDVD